MARNCAGCSRSLPRASYSVDQWSTGQGRSRCGACVNRFGACAPGASQSEVGRYNNSSDGSLDSGELENPFASGTNRWVAKGSYTTGARLGEACVVKWFKTTGAEFEADYFAFDTQAVDKAMEIVGRFNELGVMDKPVKINIPAAWDFNDVGGADWAGRRALCEPYIHNYEKFNSNTGWRNNFWGDGTKTCPLVMQALSHFSYHVTEGAYLLCDLQGGIYVNEVVLSNPVILSQTREYGVTDLGPGGISTFFHQHTCSMFCRSDWTKPAKQELHFTPVSHTTMMSL
ncbi:kinase-like domain-containing protein [Chaetomium fimeti]|uniref:Kinase-like domain-containing protein n=1 Tax=Chaetomium fimeti TaxID=1854472 RepID=A0AAE0LRE1_9PEZI|nr:kinase-like domain-containing protein [Chaetomium fimeti]